MKTLVIALLSLVSIVTAAQDRTVGAFDHLDVAGSIFVKLVPGDAPGVVVDRVKGDEEDLITSVSDGTLYIKWTKGKRGWSKKSADLTVYYVRLDQIEASSGSTVRASNAIKADLIAIDASSGSTVDLVIDATTIKAECSSGSTLRLSGTADASRIDASSGSTIDGGNLTVQKVEAEASSGSSIKIVAIQSITAKASSGASIRYGGDPKKVDYARKSMSGGSISPL